MNDFTKKELQRLLVRSYSWVSYPENQNKKELLLINKIKFMIDNYCEHLEQNEDYDYQPTRCKKCLEIIK